MARKTKVVPSVVTVDDSEIIYNPEIVSDSAAEFTAELSDSIVKMINQVTESKSLVSQLVEQVIETKVEVVTKVDEKNVGVGLFIRKLINEGLSNKDILPIVHEQYGNNNTTYACIAWYRNKMKKAGQVVTKSNNIDWIQNFAKVNGLSEESTVELMLKVG